MTVSDRDQLAAQYEPLLTPEPESTSVMNPGSAIVIAKRTNVIAAIMVNLLVCTGDCRHPWRILCPFGIAAMSLADDLVSFVSRRASASAHGLQFPEAEVAYDLV
jgi:hypothetical protein